MWGISTLALDIFCSANKADCQPRALQPDAELDTDTVVIGNGPAGIALSALLSGWHPFYNKNNPHPDPHLHEKLSCMADEGGQASLLGQDLGSLADQHFAHAEAAGASGGGHTPFAVLYDCLVRPHLTTTAYAAAAADDDGGGGGVIGHRGPGGEDAEQLADDGTAAQQRQHCGRGRSASSSSSSPRATASSASSSSSCLCWRRCEASAVPHIVLGDQQIGGSWTAYEDDMLTVSAAEWMDLPGFSLAADFVGDAQLARQRPQAGLYKAYLEAYVKAMGLQHNFRPFTRVTHIEKAFHPLSGEHFWLLRGTETAPPRESDGRQQQHTFTLRCRHVVLACGRQQPKLLGVPGESFAAANGRVVYSLNALKQQLLLQSVVPPPAYYDMATKPSTTAELLGRHDSDDGHAAAATQLVMPPPLATTTTTAPPTSDAISREQQQLLVCADCPVVVVGDGISAADAVLHCLSIEQPVLHVVRRNERELRNIQLSRLSSTVYPEYARVYRLMTGRTREVNYRRLLGTAVHSIVLDGANDGTTAATSSSAGGILLLASSSSSSSSSPFPPSSSVSPTKSVVQLREQRFRTLAICIGRRESALPLLSNFLDNKSGDGNDPSSPSGQFTTRYQSVNDPRLFAIGAIAGDHFVRFLVGGALCVAQTLVDRSKEKRRIVHLYVVVPSLTRRLLWGIKRRRLFLNRHESATEE